MSPRHLTDVRLDVDPSVHRPPPRAADRRPRSILLLADFGGRGSTEPAPPGSLRPLLVDRDTVDDVMAAVAPRVEGEDGGTLVFRSLDDLHPDELVDRLPRVGAILDGRDVPAPSAGDATPRESGAGGAGGGVSGADLLGRILDDVAGPASRPGTSAPDRPVDSVRAFAAEAARPDTLPAPDPTAQARASDARTRAGDALRTFLRRPDVRAMERRWRSVDFLTRRLDTGPGLRVYLADLSRGALAAETEAPGGLGASAFRALLAGGAGPENDPWTTVVLLDGTFGPSADDQLLLAWTTALCAAAGATLLVEGEPSLAGIPSLAELDDPLEWGPADPAWAAFRAQPEADAVGVTLPGFLLRYPYGADGDPIETFPFEEIPGAPGPGDGVWGSGALAAAVVLTREAGREERSGVPDTRLGGLPLHAWREGVDSGTLCGPVPMTDQAARRLMEAGLIPVAWARGDDGVRLLIPRSAGGRSLI